MTGQQLADKARDVAEKHKSLYVMGGFGAPLNKQNKERYTGPSAHEYNRRPERTAMIKAADADCYAVDCVGLIKMLLWGWNGNKDRVYGGAVYQSNGVPDIGANTMITKCSGISDDFGDMSKLLPGEMLWKQDHAGLYIGNGLAVECTPMWANKVQITACNCAKQGFNRRDWAKHGRLPWINYEPQSTVTAADLNVILEKAQALVADLQQLLQRAGG